jgi:glycyl-tRNA synthetase beta subunit
MAAPDWPQLLDAYARCVRIVRSQEERFTLYPERLQEPAAQRLYAAYEDAAAAKDGSLDTFVTTLRRMEPAITAFFDDVLVMAEDPAVRTNRLALLQHITALASGIADLSFLEGF